MYGMFDFLSMKDNRTERIVDNYNNGECQVDTCYVNDGSHDYETGISHPSYDYGSWIIVEAYDTRDEAQAGHDKWVKIMQTDPLPEKLTDCHNAKISQLLGCETEYYRQ